MPASADAGDQPRASYRCLARVDAWANRVYTSRLNPLYHSGAITIAMLVVLIVTGLYLLFLYRIGSPYSSVVRIQDQVWGGRWIRGVHRYASDIAVLGAVIHAFRMYAQRRAWGPRALAWMSGVLLLGAILVSGWTGYALVWDAQAQLLASEAARLLDVLPLFSEPIGRAFTGEGSVPNAFFFLMLFAHIALPIGLGVLLWVHVGRLARPVLLPARPLLRALTVCLVLLALAWPVPLALPADLLRVPSNVPMDWFFAFWLPLAQRLPAWSVWAAGGVLFSLALAVPWLTRPSPHVMPAPAVIDERTCTGCTQCVSDCPYEAITMVARTDGRATLVAHVDTDLCTSCGVCIGSCPPMSISVRGAGARDQVAAVRAFLARHEPTERDVVIVGCEWSAARAEADRSGAPFLGLPCIGAMHSSTVELLLRGGAGGVLVVGCASHDGRTREGVSWTAERLYEGRRAELKERVDRARLRLVEASLGEHVKAHAAVRRFEAEIDVLAGDADVPPDLRALCVVPVLDSSVGDTSEPVRDTE